jgi:hypothetical protein
MSTGLAWNPAFWQDLAGERLMRLNPHWHIEAEEGSEPEDPRRAVEDILVEKAFATTPKLSFDGQLFQARFSEIGLTLMARSLEGGAGTALSYSYSPVADSDFTATNADKTMRYWLPSVREYYRLYQKDTINYRLWRLFMNRVMLTMNPGQRRTCGFMLKVTVLEIVLIVALIVGWHYFGG